MCVCVCVIVTGLLRLGSLSAVLMSSPNMINTLSTEKAKLSYIKLNACKKGNHLQIYKYKYLFFKRSITRRMQQKTVFKAKFEC